MGTLTVVNMRDVLKNAKVLAYSNLSRRIATQKAANPGTRAWAAMLYSNGSGTSGALSFMNSAHGQHSTSYFSKQAYRDKVRSILMVGAFNDHPGGNILCDCGEQYNNPLHSLVCNNNAPSFTRRHTACRDALISVIKSVLPNARVEKEKVVGMRLLRSEGGLAPKQIKVICDIKLQNGPVDNTIDLMIVEPSCDHYCENKPGRNIPRSCEVVNAAAVIGEKFKTNHYGKVRIINGVPGRINLNNFVPFVIESSGRLGPKALEFLTLICGTETYKRSKFIKDISLICARFYGSVLTKSRGPIPVQPQNGVV
jgi:hypothetical protein